MFTKMLRTLLVAGPVALAAATAQAGDYFVDEFDGEQISSDWEVLNEDVDSYIVEEGALLAIASGSASLTKGDVANIFRLRKPLPQGDWVATMQYSMPYQTGREAPFFGLYGDKDNFFAVSPYAWSYYDNGSGARLFLGARKAAKGRSADFANVIWGGADGQAFDIEEAPNPFVVRITKKGRTYTPAVKLSIGAEENWYEFQSITLLREPGGLAFGIHQGQEVGGETPILVDWVRVEVVQ